MEPDVFDPQLAIDRAAGNTDLANKLLGMLLDELPTYREGMTRAWHASDLEAIGNHAHRLAGATRYTAVPTLNRTVEKLHSMLKNGTVDIAEPLTDVVEAIDRLLTVPPRL